MKNLEEMNKEELIERIKFLENQATKSGKVSDRVYKQIGLMVAEKVEKEIPKDEIEGKTYEWTRERARRELKQDLRWDLRIRNIKDFAEEHLKPAEEYIKNYVFSDDLKKSRWAKC